MKIYCSCCDKVQPVLVEDCRDAKTNELFQDIVCVDCHLVIASGTDIKRTWVGLTDEEIIIMSRYDLEYAVLIGEVQRKLKEKNCG